MSLWAFGWETPEAVIGHYLDTSAQGVPFSVSATLYFARGRSASFNCSFTSALSQFCVIHGSRGVLTMDDFVLPRSEHCVTHHVERDIGLVHNDRLVVGDRTTVSTSHSHLERQEVRMISRFCELVSTGPSEFYPHVALQTQEVTDAIAKSAKEGGSRVLLSGVDQSGAEEEEETEGGGEEGGVGFALETGATGAMS